MQKFEYLIRSDFDEKAENASRSFGSKEGERKKAYAVAINEELNKMGAEGWELVQAPDQIGNNNWIFKRSVTE
jgi:hypothetical protein